MRPRSAMASMCRSRRVGAVSAVSLGTAPDRGGTITAAPGCRAATSAQTSSRSNAPSPVECAVGGDGGDRTIDLVEQGADPRAVVAVVAGQHRRDDPPGVGVRGEVQLLPRPARPAAVLLDQPLPGPAQTQPRAVDQQVRRLASRAWARRFERLGPAAEGRVVRHGEVEPEQAEDGADQALGLAQRKAEHRPQRQRRGDRQRRVVRLPAGRGPGLRLPGRDRLVGEPDGQAPASAQGGVVGRPVRHPVALPRDVVPANGIGLERHGLASRVSEGAVLLSHPPPGTTGRSVQQGPGAP